MRHSGAHDFVLKFIAVTAATLLFTVAFPNPLFPRGLGFVAFIAYIPLFAVIGRSPIRHCVFFGAWYGLLSTALFNYWLYNFHPFALPLVCTILMVYYAAFFPLLRLAVRLCPTRHYIPQSLLWVGFEYARSLGFLGYTFGISGYSQWRCIPLIQAASFGGVWVISALVIFPQTLAASVLTRIGALKEQRGGSLPLAPAPLRVASAAPSPKGAGAPLKSPTEVNSPLVNQRCLKIATFFAALAPSHTPASPPLVNQRCPKTAAFFVIPAAYIVILAACLVYGSFFRPTSEGLPQRRIALIQQNDNPWKNGVEEYRKTLNKLTALSDRALTQSAADGRPVDLVVWPETAFVPMIYWHTRYRTDNAYYLLVKELTDYLAEQDAPFLIGNDDGRRETRNGRIERVDYNAALLFSHGELAEVYRKQRLVPFSEYFPYKKQLPFVHTLLEKAGVTFWEPGTEPVIFKTSPVRISDFGFQISDGFLASGGQTSRAGGPVSEIRNPKSEIGPRTAGTSGFRFATPICFEDSFGSISRQFTQLGAEIIVNMTNDSWGKSRACQNQHLAMSVFRAVENRRSVVRAATSGQTCAIAPDGALLAEAPPFTEAFVNADVPVASGLTFYTKHGDFFPLICLAAAALLLIFGFVKTTICSRNAGVKTAL